MTTTTLMQQAEIEDVQVDGLNVRYAISGNGPVVLLVHGLATSMITWCRNINALAAAGFTAVALDLPGYGGSSLADHRGYSPDSAASFLVDFADELGIDRFSVVGNSGGGLVAGVTALDHPDRVDQVALVGSAGLGKRVSWPLRLISIPVVGELIYKPEMIGKDALVKRIFHRPPDFLDEIIPEMVRVRCLPHGPHVMLQSVRSGVNLLGLRPEHQILDRLAELEARLLVVWGEEDLVIPPISEEDVRRAAPESTIRVLPECGHWPHMEKPDAFNDILVRFLSQPSVPDFAPGQAADLSGYPERLKIVQPIEIPPDAAPSGGSEEDSDSLGGSTPAYSDVSPSVKHPWGLHFSASWKRPPAPGGAGLRSWWWWPWSLSPHIFSRTG